MKRFKFRWKLIAYDTLVLLAAAACLPFISPAIANSFSPIFILQILTAFLCLLLCRMAGGVYQQIWRYGGIQCYLRLILVDTAAFFVNTLVFSILPYEGLQFEDCLTLSGLTLLGTLFMRMAYRYSYKNAPKQSTQGKISRRLMLIFARENFNAEDHTSPKTKIAIIGAGRLGVTLAEELRSNISGPYIPACFIDADPNKAGREIQGLPVLAEEDATFAELREHEIQEVVFAIQNISAEKRKAMYDWYVKAGFKAKVYDYPVSQSAGGKRHMRDFDIEELLFRKPIRLSDDATTAYYRDKVILITGGGGSIGSELCRQLAQMGPRQIIILDIYENGAYDVQQELRMAYGTKLDIQIEIASITSVRGMSRVFEAYRPQIVINAAAHKHVPLMEHNCIEAVENNVFGTKLLVDLCETYHAERFMMVSTDKAVNPTNVMGATKRMCEMIVQSASTHGSVKYSATRFGNVLGSAGSVIPLFRRQIAAGGPVTLTDKRIIRYFMTIPEASQLVLQSGAMAKSGELFVLDMGQPVRILDLAENMISLSGVQNIEIVETGLRPGEKLYEELLVKTEELEKTANSMIFVERDVPLSREEIEKKLEILHYACLSGDDNAVRDALKQVVPTFRSPEEVNAEAEKSEEMKERKNLHTA